MSGCDGFSDNDGEVPEMLSAIPVKPADQSEGTPCFLCTGTKPITKTYYGKPLDVCCWNGIRAKLHQLKRKGPEAVQADVAQMLSDTGAWRKGTLPFTGGPSERSLARVEMHKIVSTTETLDVQQKVRIDDDLGLTKPRYISYIVRASRAGDSGLGPVENMDGSGPSECGREASGARWKVDCRRGDPPYMRPSVGTLLRISFCIGLRRVSRASMRKECGGQVGLGRKWRAGGVSLAGSFGPRVSSAEAGCEAAVAHGAEHAGTHRRRRPTAPCDGPARPAPTSRLGDPSAPAASCLSVQRLLNVRTKLLVCRSGASASDLVRWGVVHRGQVGGRSPKCSASSSDPPRAHLEGWRVRVDGRARTGVARQVHVARRKRPREVGPTIPPI
jgi:hypothetical protein